MKPNNLKLDLSMKQKESKLIKCVDQLGTFPTGQETQTPATKPASLCMDHATALEDAGTAATEYFHIVAI